MNPAITCVALDVLPSKMPEYQVWADMRTRCNNPRHRQYLNYGGRGIKVCGRWDSFAAFMEDMGRRPQGKWSIERKDNSKGYSPDNCKWATASEQLRNTRRTLIIEFDGKRMCVADWARELGISESGLWGRIGRRKSPEDAIRFQDLRADNGRYLKRKIGLNREWLKTAKRGSGGRFL